MILRIIYSIIFLPLIYFYGGNLFSLIKSMSFSDPTQSIFLFSFLGSTVIFLIFLKDMSFISIFEHELTHNIWAILTFNKPEGFHVWRGEKGLFQYSGRRNYMLTLSPYFFLTFSFLFLPIFIFIQAPYFKYFIIGLGILTGFHTSTTIKETSTGQADLHVFGLLFSFIFIILGNIVSYGIILSFVTGSWDGIKDFLLTGIVDLIGFVRNSVTTVMGK